MQCNTKLVEELQKQQKYLLNEISIIKKLIEIEQAKCIHKLANGKSSFEEIVKNDHVELYQCTICKKAKTQWS